jgi:hypothetical protein
MKLHMGIGPTPIRFRHLFSGSARQSGQMRNLRGFPESDEFGLSGGQALCL